MAEFTVEQIVNRARVYISDDHDDNGGFIAPERWVDIFNAEYTSQYAEWVRSALISPAPEDETFSTHTTTVEGVLALIGVAEDLGGGSVRVLKPAQSTWGRSPFWGYSSGNAEYWTAHGTDDLTLTLEPRVDASYFARYIPIPELPAELADEVDVPFGQDERLVLGVARRAKLKDGSASALLERLKLEADRDFAFRAHGRANGDAPRVRRVRETAPRVTGWETDPRMWRYA
jgi:hypothetical protein